MKSRSELVLNGSVKRPCLRQALSESHISGESFPRLLRSESGTILEILRSPIVDQTEQLDEVSFPSLGDSYDERLMQLLDCHRSPKYFDEATGAVYAPYTPPIPLACDRSLSEILSRTCTEICSRFSKLKQQLLGVQAGTSANNAQEQKSPNTQPNDPQYLFGPSDSFPPHIARRPEVRRINFSQSVNDLHQTNLENITPPSQLQHVYHSTPLPQGQTSAENMQLNQSTAMSSGYYSHTSTPVRNTPIFQPNNTCSEENLNDVSIPTYAEFSRRDHTEPSEMLENISSVVIRSLPAQRSCICKRKRKYNQNYSLSPRLEDISAPSFQNTECLEDQSLPTQLLEPIVLTPLRPMRRAVNIEASSRMVCKRTRNLPDEQIADVSTPKFESTRIYMTNECLEDVSMPSQFTSTPQSQQRPQTFRPRSNIQNSMRSEKLEDISMPCSPNLDHSQIVYTNVNRSFPDERLMDVSAPVFESTPMQAQERRQYQNIESVSTPGLVQYSACSPSFSSPLECSRKQRPNQCQMSYPSENLENITSPGYDAKCSRQATPSSNYLDQQSAITDSSNRRPIPQRQRVISNTYSSENLNDISVPVFEKSSPRQNQQTPLAGSRYCRPINQRQREISKTYSCENLNDISVPVFEKSSPRQNQQTPLAGSRYCRPINQRQRNIPITYSSENLNDISVPVFEKSSPRRNQQTPLAGSRYCRPIPRRQRVLSNTYSCENLNDISVPVFEKSSPRQNQQTPLAGSRFCRPIIQRQRVISNTYSSENLNDISVPVFETSSPRQNQQTPLAGPIYCRPINQRQRDIPNTYSSENLNDISVPVFENSSPRQIQQNPLRGFIYCRPINQKKGELSNTYSSENLNDVSVPVFENSSPRPNQQTPLEGSIYYRPINQRKREISNTYSSENLNDISVPVFENSSPSPNQQTLLAGPIYYRPINQRKREISNTYSSENLNDVSIPEYEQSSQTTNDGQSRAESRSHKSLSRFFSRSKSRSPARDTPHSPVHSKNKNRVKIQNQFTDASSEYLDDITPPHSHQNSTLNRSKSEYITDTSMPSMNPSYEQTPVRSRQTPKSIQKQRDVSAKSNKKSANKSPSTHQSRLSKERIRNMSKSDLERVKRRLILPTERLEDQSMPSMAGSPQITSTPIPERKGVYNTPCIRQNDTSNPSADSHISALVNCLNNMLISHFGVTMSPQKVSSLTKEQLNDITIPNSSVSPSQYILTITPNEQIQNVTMPSLPPDTPVTTCPQTSRCATYEKLEDISMPTLEDCIYPDQSGINFDINNPNHRGVYVCDYHENECLPRQMYECEFTTSPFNDNNQQQQLIENESPPRFISVSRNSSGTDSNDSESENKETNLKSFLNTTKDVFSKLGESKQNLQKQSLSPETTKRETTPVVPIPGTLRSLQNFRSFLATNRNDENGKTEKSNKFHDKVLNSISKPDFTPTKTAEETTFLENISAPEFNSTAMSLDQPLANSKEVRAASLPSPGTISSFKNFKTFADLARNSVKERERKKLESTKLEDISSPTFDLTPSQSSKNLDEQKPTTSAQSSKKERQKQKDHKKDNTTKDDLQNTSAPSFASTPESIPQMRNYKTPTRAKHNKESTTSIPKMRAYSTSKIDNGPSTSRGAPTNKSSTSLGSRKRHAPPSKEPQRQKSTPMIKNSRTQTSTAVLWNEIDVRRLRATSIPPQPQTYQQTQPTYQICSSCYQVYVPPTYYYVNYDPCQTQNQEIVYEYLCEMCEGRRRSRSC